MHVPMVTNTILTKAPPTFFLIFFRTANIKDGCIKVNGKDRNISQFRKLSAYIMQDNQLHGNLTVEEAMTVATNLKLSPNVDKNEKNFVVSFLQKCNIYG